MIFLNKILKINCKNNINNETVNEIIKFGNVVKK